ncbi:zinc finger SWIM domain-containing protein 7 isoform X4 [Lepidochelys kempii]|uniref:zinc finger SWIM domain-containing protein 7 isoform X4 n=1 Tax=Lepidochelys kempii TaxID=8472 RepID=UPI003C6F9C33
MPCGPPTEESHVPACRVGTQRGTCPRAASLPGLSWSLQQFKDFHKTGILCLIPPPPSGEVQHSSLGLGAARTGRCLQGAARGFTWVSREMEATLPAVAEQLLKEIQKAFQETAHVPDDLLLAHENMKTLRIPFRGSPTCQQLSPVSRLSPEVGAGIGCPVGEPEERRENDQCASLLLIRLKFVFGSSAVAALDLVDQHSVTRIVSSSGRAVYQVLGSSGKLYTCYASCHFCTCPAFAFSVLRKSDSLVLASILLAEEEEEGRRTLDHVLTPSLLQRLPGSSEVHRQALLTSLRRASVDQGS